MARKAQLRAYAMDSGVAEGIASRLPEQADVSLKGFSQPQANPSRIAAVEIARTVLHPLTVGPIYPQIKGVVSGVQDVGNFKATIQAWDNTDPNINLHRLPGMKLALVHVHIELQAKTPRFVKDFLRFGRQEPQIHVIAPSGPDIG
jgi:hypothetical protein